ncbi:MAG TPA: diaminopimelate epimerase [Gemmatimonadales bacterium]|nr:diaminopimelate epimerase [Gemmatimonadales bacterium]
MTVSFYKMTGSGNDFVFLDGRTHAVADWSASDIAAICDRRTGVGGDGLVVATPEGADGVRMVYFNADGSRAGMCGNAALCTTRLAARLGIAPGSGMQLHSDTGILRTRCVGPGWGAELLLPDFSLPEPVTLPLAAHERWMVLCTVGVPHLIVLVDDLAAVDVIGRGKELRRDPTFAPGGLNVNFVGPNARTGDAAWGLRTYERGVEDETLACGTGTVGAAFALAMRGHAVLPVRIASWGGNLYSVAGRLEGTMAREPWLCGEGRLVFEGTWPGTDPVSHIAVTTDS